MKKLGFIILLILCIHSSIVACRIMPNLPYDFDTLACKPKYTAYTLPVHIRHIPAGQSAIYVDIDMLCHNDEPCQIGEIASNMTDMNAEYSLEVEKNAENQAKRLIIRSNNTHQGLAESVKGSIVLDVLSKKMPVIKYGQSYNKVAVMDQANISDVTFLALNIPLAADKIVKKERFIRFANLRKSVMPARMMADKQMKSYIENTDMFLEKDYTYLYSLAFNMQVESVDNIILLDISKIKDSLALYQMALPQYFIDWNNDILLEPSADKQQVKISLNKHNAGWDKNKKYTIKLPIRTKERVQQETIDILADNFIRLINNENAEIIGLDFSHI